MSELIIRGGNPSQQRPEQVFCEQAGWHCLVTFNTEDTHYFHVSTSQSLLLSKLHSFSICSVGWSRNSEQYNTIEFDPVTETVKHNYSKLFEVNHAIFGIEYIIFSGLPSKISVVVACPNHLYQFTGFTNEQGRPNFLETFKNYKDNAKKLQRAVHEFSGEIKKSQLQLYYQHYRAESFA